MKKTLLFVPWMFAACGGDPLDDVATTHEAGVSLNGVSLKGMDTRVQLQMKKTVTCYASKMSETCGALSHFQIGALLMSETPDDH